jgi:hypothetical protein
VVYMSDFYDLIRMAGSQYTEHFIYIILSKHFLDISFEINLQGLSILAVAFSSSTGPALIHFREI